MLNIKNHEADELARLLSHMTGESITNTVISALKEKLLREEGRRLSVNLKDEIMKIGKRCSELADLDKRTPDQIIGYNDYGVTHTDTHTSIDSPKGFIFHSR